MIQQGLGSNVLYFGWISTAIQADQHVVSMAENFGEMSQKVASFIPREVS